MKTNQIYHGDCLEIMKNIKDKSIDMILADLPYGITKCKWDIPIDLAELWKHYERIIKNNGAIILTATQPFTSKLILSNLKRFRYTLVWEKTQATGFLNANRQPMRAHEDICIFYKRQPKFNPQKTFGHKPVNTGTRYVTTHNKTEIYGKIKEDMTFGGSTERFPRSVILFKSDKQKSHLHPTQKPVDLGRYLIKSYSQPSQLILDNCCGSGSFIIAAILENREYIGIEKEQKYIDITNKRINNLSKEKCNYCNRMKNNTKLCYIKDGTNKRAKWKERESSLYPSCREHLHGLFKYIK